MKRGSYKPASTGTFAAAVTEVDRASVAKARRAFDVTGHYARPDLFQLRVNDEALAPVVFGGASEG